MVFSQSKVLRDNDSERIVKKYNGLNSGKWMFSPLLWLFYPFAISSKSRLERELDFLDSDNDIKKPKIYDYSLKNREITREYINGTVKPYDGRKIGKVLYDVHKNGYSLGDSKLDNFICDKNNAYIIDSEQSIKTERRRYVYWDVSLLLLSAAYYNYSEIKNFKSFISDFSENYAYWQEYKHNAIKGFHSMLFLLMPTQHIKALKEILYG